MSDSSSRSKVHRLPQMWLVPVFYEKIRPAVQPFVDEGKIEKIVHGTCLGEFKESLEEFRAPGSDLEIIFVMQSPKAPEILRPLLEESTDEQKKRVLWVHSLPAGVDGFKLQEMPQDIFNGVKISNAHGVFSSVLAEHVVFVSLYFLRRTSRLQRNQNNRVWEQTTNPVLKDQKIGIFGYGHIGRECANMLRKGFLVKDIQGWKRSPLPSGLSVDDLGTKVVHGASGFEDTVERSDIIINILPQTQETDHIFKKEVFDRMKSNAIFINIGRGTTVKEVDLAEALRTNAISGAALDVFEVEPLPKDSPLYAITTEGSSRTTTSAMVLDDKLLLTPHDAVSVYFPAMQHFARNLEVFLKTRSLDHIEHWVDPSLGY